MDDSNPLIDKSVKTTGFTLNHYKEHLQATAALYPFVGFEILDQGELPNRFAILRHDIDMSPRQALALAEIEASLGIRATYTILLTGEFYSPFERKTRDMLRHIVDLGHDLGLHFDAAWHGIATEEKLNDAITWELEVLNNLLSLDDKHRVRMFSFHNTTSFTMACKASHYAGLRNAYAEVLQTKVGYTSDSNGYWIHRTWDQLLREGHDRIQVLTHPEWWRPSESEPAEKVCHEIAYRGEKIWESYRVLLERGRRHNRMGLQIASDQLRGLFKKDGDRLLMLWLEGRRSEAYIELYCRFERRSRRLLRRCLQVITKASGQQSRAVLSDGGPNPHPLLTLAVLMESDIKVIAGTGSETLNKLQAHRDALVRGYPEIAPEELARSFDELTVAINSLSRWRSESLKSLLRYPRQHS